MKLYIYNENCVSAGKIVSVSILDNYEGNIDEAGDWSCVEGSPLELIEFANLIKTNTSYNIRRRDVIAQAALEELSPNYEGLAIIICEPGSLEMLLEEISNENDDAKEILAEQFFNGKITQHIAETLELFDVDGYPLEMDLVVEKR